uniref:Aa_trans domain-containing protein n=1 Tax=Angiostrongylus cantonensis TaxID=6313 RepID=A0A0K0D885_ANGCA
RPINSFGIRFFAHFKVQYGAIHVQRWRVAGAVTATATSCALGLLAIDPLRIHLLNDLPTFKKEDVKKHGKESKRIWVTYKGVKLVTFTVLYYVGSSCNGVVILAKLRIAIVCGGERTRYYPFWELT